MAQNFLRTVKVELDGKTFTYDGTKPDNIADGRDEGPGLRIRFDIHQRDFSTPNHANIYIYNVARQSEQAALKRGGNVRLSAGYGGETVELFKGQILQARTNVRENPGDPDTALVILGTDSGFARNYAVVNKTLPAGHTHADRAQACIDAMKQMGVSQGYIATSALSKIKFPRGVALFGMAKDLLRSTCTTTNTSFSIQNGKAQILENAKTLPGGAIPLRGDTGLLGLPVQTIQGVEARTQLNGRIVVGSTVSIASALIQQSSFSPNMQFATGELTPENQLLESNKLATDGLYKVYVVEHAGDTRGETFETSIICARLGALPNPALANRSTPNPELAQSAG